MTSSTDLQDFDSTEVSRLRGDLAVALRAAAYHGLAEGVCNHFSMELPDRSGRFLYNGLALDISEGQRIAAAMQGADIAFLGNHGVVVCGSRIDHAYDDLYYLERACMAQVLAHSTGRPLLPDNATLARRVCEQTLGERLQSELFFEALRRTI